MAFSEIIAKNKIRKILLKSAGKTQYNRRIKLQS